LAIITGSCKDNIYCETETRDQVEYYCNS